jgi:hypothetical protein
MESKKMIRIAMRLSEAIVEILKEEFGEDKKVKENNARRKKKMVKRNS